MKSTSHSWYMSIRFWRDELHAASSKLDDDDCSSPGRRGNRLSSKQVTAQRE